MNLYAASKPARENRPHVNMDLEFWSLEEVKKTFHDDGSNWSAGELHLAQLLSSKTSHLERQRQKSLKWERRAQEIERRLKNVEDNLNIWLSFPRDENDYTMSLVEGDMGVRQKTALQFLEDMKEMFEDDDRNWSPRELHLAQHLSAMTSQLERQREQRLKWERKAELLAGRLDYLKENLRIKVEFPDLGEDYVESLRLGLVGPYSDLTSDDKKERAAKEKERKEQERKEKKYKKAREKQEKKNREEEKKAREEQMKKERKEREEKDKKQKKEQEKEKRERKEREEKEKKEKEQEKKEKEKEKIEKRERKEREEKEKKEKEQEKKEMKEQQERKEKKERKEREKKEKKDRKECEEEEKGKKRVQEERKGGTEGVHEEER
ncbi:uncharacterized protein LOC144009378 [Festucalex cinctus]